MCKVEGMLDKNVVGYTVLSSFPAYKKLPCNSVISCFDVFHTPVHPFWELHDMFV